MIDIIRNLKGSDGQIGWPVDTRDRISFPSHNELRVTDANVGVAFLWTMRDLILPKLNKNNLAIAANFYTPSGIQSMVRNILANPYLRYVILFGDESSSKNNNPKFLELTSANAIRTFFSKGFNDQRKIEGFGDSVILDKNIPLEEVQKIIDNVELIDLNISMKNSSLDEKISKANELIENLPKKSPFSFPKTFEYEDISESFPYEGGPITIHGGNIPDCWVKMIYVVNRYGQKNLMNERTDRVIKEINDMTVVIHHPQDMDLTVNPFLIPLTLEKIEAYREELLSPILPSGKAYTYGNKLRAYISRSPQEIKKLVETKEFKDFEFGQGPHLDFNVTYNKDYCEIDQIKDIIEVLKRDRYSKACMAITWYPADELMRKHKSSPCMVSLQALVQNEKLNLTVYFRSHDMVQGWPENAYGFAAIQAEIAKSVGLETGLLIIISGSAQIYRNYFKQVENMLKKYYPGKNTCFDDRGNYRIEVKGKNIVVSLLHPTTGRVLEKFVGKTVYELRDKIGITTQIPTNHALYIGSELAVAEFAIKNNQSYEQDTTF